MLVIGLPRFPEQGLAGAFRQVQAFATHRVTEYHAWARWDSGTLERMYVYDGSRGVVTVQTGELTAQDVAKITDIAMTETGYTADQIKIMPAN